MSRKRFKFCFESLIPIILGSIGLGMFLAIILPFWVWIAAAGIGLIVFAWWCFWDR